MEPNERPTTDDTRFTTPHLRHTLQHLSSDMPRFLSALETFLEHPMDDPTGLKTANLRLYAQLLKRKFETIDGLLASIEEQRRPHERADKERP